MGSRCVQFVAIVLTLSFWYMTPHGKELSEDLKKNIVALHKDGVGQWFSNWGPRPPGGPLDGTRGAAKKF